MNLTFANIDNFCSSIILKNPGPGKVPVWSVIDMQGVTFVEPFALIYLGLFIRFHRRAGFRFKVLIPRSPRVRRYIESQKFWQRYGFDSGHTSGLPSMGLLTSFNDIVQVNSGDDIGEEIADKVRDLLSRDALARRSAYQVGELVSELVDNFAQHSEADDAACVLQRYPQIGRTDFAIGDIGIGIRRSLVQNRDYEYLHHQSDQEAAELAFTPGVGRRIEGGMGLGEVAESVQNLSGQLFLATGDGWVLFRGGEYSSGSQDCDLSGVQIEVSIPDGG